MWHFLLFLCLFGFTNAATEPAEDPRVKSLPCPGIPSWFSCPGTGLHPLSGYCVSPSQLCDGRSDCADSDWDESEAVCGKRSCSAEEGAVRCASGGTCIRVPYRHVCNGGNDIFFNFFVSENFRVCCAGYHFCKDRHSPFNAFTEERFLRKRCILFFVSRRT